MKFDRTRVFNFENAIHGARNPLNSWDKSDSIFNISTGPIYPEDAQIITYFSTHEDDSATSRKDELNSWAGNIKSVEYAKIGPIDKHLLTTLIKCGTCDSKFLRQIFVSVDITAPMYLWSELDTYKVATVANSTSKMHKLASTPITFDCFEHDDYKDVSSEKINSAEYWNNLIDYCEYLRTEYNNTKDKKYWKELIRILPESWLQTRTWTCNYQTLAAMCSSHQRRNHKLNEWSGIDNYTKENFIKWARSLPYAKELIFTDELEENN